MKRHYLLIPALAALFSLQAQAQILSHIFDEGTGTLNGTNVDAGSGSWVALNEVNANGAFTGGAGSATLAFTPSQGTQYQLDASITGVTGNGDWIALGFANGSSTDTATAARFTDGGTPVGRAWMITRGDNTSFANRAFTEGNSGTGSADWTGSLATANGGDFDLRILLDTTGGATNWTATWFAKRPADGSYTEVLSATSLPDEGIDSVGFSFAGTGTTGNLQSLSLTQVPEPSAFPLIAGCFGLAWVMVRRRQS